MVMMGTRGPAAARGRAPHDVQQRTGGRRQEATTHEHMHTNTHPHTRERTHTHELGIHSDPQLLLRRSAAAGGRLHAVAAAQTPRSTAACTPAAPQAHLLVHRVLHLHDLAAVNAVRLRRGVQAADAAAASGNDGGGARRDDGWPPAACSSSSRATVIHHPG